jgi:DNA-binding SARP family transcriptional activator/tetratricopeptide (TPR) repeat protein
MEFRILGPLEVRQDEKVLPLGGAKQRALLAILLLHANEVVSIDRLVDELWGDAAPESAIKTLQVHVSQLRKSLGDADVLVTRPPGYLLRVEEGELDAERFERLVSGARSQPPARAAAMLRDALALWRGPPLADLAYESFAQAEIGRLEEQRAATLEGRVEAELALGRHADLIGELESLVARHPLRERLRGQLMLALYRSGRQAEALEVYRDTRRALVEELGIEPSRELQELERQILGQDASLEAPPLAPVAAAIEGEARPPLIGREGELAAVAAGLDGAIAGRGALFLIGGDAGIGKTRLCDELAARARQRGARALFGRCWEAGGAPGYWPWAQSLRAYMRERDPTTVRAQLGTGAPVVAQILPELRELFPDLGEPPALDPDAGRFRLFGSIAGFARAAAEDTPLVLVLDDLHAADAPSLLLLRFLADELADSRVLLIGAYREVGLARDHPLRSTLGELGRLPNTKRLVLHGLPQADVARMVELIAGSSPSERLVEAVQRETEGNPLFVVELVRLLASEGRLEQAESDPLALGVPEGIRDVISRRLERLSERCRSVLTVASVLGREFNLEALEQMSEVPGESLVELLEEATDARLIAEVPGSAHRLQFGHTLIRETLYGDLIGPRRARLHSSAGAALERLYGADSEPRAAELAHHFYEALPAGEQRRAVEYGRRAADRASRMLAYEEAVRLYSMALDALSRGRPISDRDRCELLLALGDARTRAGDLPGGKENFGEAAELAGELGLTEALARAALGYGGRFVFTRAGSDRKLVPLLERALDAVGGDDSELRARLLARLACALRDQPGHYRSDALSSEAVAVAERVRDPATLSWALDGRHVVIWKPETVDERLAIATRMLGLTEDTGLLEPEMLAHDYRTYAFLEMGDLPAVHREVEATIRSVERLHQPAFFWKATVVCAMVALFEGQLEEAERLSEEAFEAGRRSTHGATAANSHAIQMLVLRREQGRLEEIEGQLRAAIEQDPTYPVLSCALAHLCFALGQRGEAGEVLRVLSENEFAALPRNEEWLFGLSLLAPVCAGLGERSQAGVLHRVLLPHAVRNAIGVPEAALGCVAHPLGLLAQAIGRPADAARHFELAIELNERMGARPAAAHSRFAYARLLLDQGDGERARELARSAREAYLKLGMESWADAAVALDRARAALL